MVMGKLSRVAHSKKYAVKTFHLRMIWRVAVIFFESSNLIGLFRSSFSPCISSLLNSGSVKIWHIELVYECSGLYAVCAGPNIKATVAMLPSFLKQFCAQKWMYHEINLSVVIYKCTIEKAVYLLFLNCRHSVNCEWRDWKISQQQHCDQHRHWNW